MCLTVCLGSPGLKSCLLHSDCSLYCFQAPHLRYHPPSRERQAAPGRTRLGRAPQDTAVQPGYSCLCLFARCLLFSVNVFLIINVGLAAAQCGSHGGRACRISLVLRDSAGPGCGPGETGSSMLSLGGASGGIAAWWVQQPLQSMGRCQHALGKDPWRSQGGLGRRRWAWLKTLLHVPSPTPLSRNSNVCQARESHSFFFTFHMMFF